MEEWIEVLRLKLYEAIDKGNSDEILKASEELDLEIVKLLLDCNRLLNHNEIQTLETIN